MIILIIMLEYGYIDLKRWGWMSPVPYGVRGPHFSFCILYIAEGEPEDILPAGNIHTCYPWSRVEISLSYDINILAGRYLTFQKA